MVDSGIFLGQPARSQTIDQNPKAVFGRRWLVRAFDPEHVPSERSTLATDLLIGTYCNANDCALLRSDRGFDPITRYPGLRAL